MKDDTIKIGNTKIIMPYNLNEHFRKKRYIETLDIKNGISWLKKQCKFYKGVDLKQYDNVVFRGQRGEYKNKKFTWNNKFIYGTQINEYKYDDVSGYIINDEENVWRLYGVNQNTLGLRAPINGYRKNRRNKMVEIMMFEGDIVKLSISVMPKLTGFIGTVCIENGAFCVKGELGSIGIDKYNDLGFWEILNNTAGIKVKITDEIRIN